MEEEICRFCFSEQNFFVDLKSPSDEYKNVAAFISEHMGEVCNQIQQLVSNMEHF